MLPMFDLESQKQRGMMYRRIRDFFDGRGYLEIFTPTLSPTLGLFLSEAGTRGGGVAL